MERILIEACCGSADDAVRAEAGGADRAELNSCLFMGGLTPSAGMLETAKAHVKIPVMVMLRPRGGGFDYTALEFEAMLRDGRDLLDRGADGIVFGCLDRDGTVNAERVRALTQLAGEKDTVFHRAIDVTPDWKRALDTLIRSGVRRVLTSGQKNTAYEGRVTLREMIAFAGDSIEILPGAGIGPENAAELVRYTGAGQIHLGGKRERVPDLSAARGGIRFTGETIPVENGFEMSSREAFALVRARLEGREG